MGSRGPKKGIKATPLPPSAGGDRNAFADWHTDMEAEYQRLRAKHFKDGVKTGKKTKEERESEAKALMELRKEMPNSKIVIQGLSQHIKDKLGTSADSVILSASTYAKQMHNHPDITPSKYASLLGKIKDSKISYQQPLPQHIGIVLEDGKRYAAILKATEHSQVYLVSLYEISGKSLKRFQVDKNKMAAPGRP